MRKEPKTSGFYRLLDLHQKSEMLGEVAISNVYSPEMMEMINIDFFDFVLWGAESTQYALLDGKVSRIFLN